MRLFVDASALVAILLREEDALAQAERIEAASEPLWSAIAKWETIAALCRSRQFTPMLARNDVDAFGRDYRLRLVPIGEDEAALAYHAFRLYGKGLNPVGLNMGDCFAYACAKANDAQLLYKGDDFAQTDLA